MVRLLSGVDYCWGNGFGSGGNNLIWQSWITSASQTTTGGFNTRIIYPTFDNQMTGATTTNIDIIWCDWNGIYIPTPNQVQSNQNPLPTNADMETRLWREMTELKQKKELARKAAKDLLTANLTPAQVKELETHKFFTVHSRTHQRTYRVRQGRAGNVLMIDGGGRIIEQICIHPTIDCPDEDTMLAQKLMLETDEDYFLKTANRTKLTSTAA